jgi:hypothetical protein
MVRIVPSVPTWRRTPDAKISVDVPFANCVVEMRRRRRRRRRERELAACDV